MQVFETEARIGHIISIDGTFDRLCILYPTLGLSLRHEGAIRRGLKTGSMLATSIKNQVCEYDGHNNDTEFPVLNIRRKVLGFCVANGAAS